LKSKSEIRVLVTAAGGAPGYNVINALKRQKEKKVKIIATDIDFLSVGLYLADKHYLVPKANDPKFIDEILSICKKENIKVIFPGISHEFPAFSKNKKIFEAQGIKIPISDWSTVQICADKIRTFRFFKKNKIPTPKTYLAKDLPKKPIFPLIIKPSVSSGTKNVFKIENIEELKFFLPRVKKPVIQEFIEGQEYTIDAAADFESNLIAAIPRLRLETMDGKSIKGVTVKDDVLVSMIQEIIKKLKIVGPANIQCFKQNNNYLFTEVNCRFAAGGLPLAVAAGVNIPLLLLKICLGEKIDRKKIKPREKLYMIRYFSEIFIEEKKKGLFSRV
jgi:carbamoyl-phosphate synthase large subunit